MAQYIVSARKYRPDSFETLVGQDNIAQTLKNSIQRGQLAHAYLFCGPRGVGKTSTARIFAKTINCSNPGAEMEPCGECESCRSFAEGRSYCIHELDAASNNGVDDIKALMEQVMVPPQVGRYSVYIIDEVHMLSQAAFNAFLKTLEEPPAHAIFILATTEKHKIIPTILSRCQTYDFNRITVAGIVNNLKNIASKEGITIDDESLHVIARKADGAMRDALTLFDQAVAFCGTDIHYADVVRNLGVLDYECSFRLVDDFLQSDYAAALSLFDDILSKGFNAQHFISALSSHLRDLMVCQTAGLDALLDMPDSLKGKYREQAGRCSVKFLYDALAIATDCEARYKSSVNPRLHVEFALMKMAFLSRGVPQPSVNAATVQPAPAPSPAQSALTQSAPQPAVSAAPQSVAPQPAVAAPQQVSAPDPASQPAGQVVPAEAPQVSRPAAQPAPAASEPAAPSPAQPLNTAASAEGGQSQESPAPRSRRGAARAGAGLSLTALMQEEEKAQQMEVVSENDRVPAEDEMPGAWMSLSDAYASMPRLFHALKGAPLTIGEFEGNRSITFKVDNQAQKLWIEEKLIKEMEGRLRDILGTSRVRIFVDVIPQTEQPQTAYTAEEKARELVKDNKNVRDFITEMGLDIN